MRRRRLIRFGGLAVVGSLAGCGSEADTGAESTTTDQPTTASGAGKPDGVYIQSFRERMSMQGTAQAGDYAFALLFAVPHDFWTVTGDTVSKTTKTDADSLHLMASVWDPETRIVLPETGLSVEITRDDEMVSQEVIYPMLSQPMGFHYGGNFELDGDGSYTVTLSVGGMAVQRTGAFDGRFGEPATVEIPLEFTPESRDEVTARPIEQAGNPGALRPMEMPSSPQAVAPSEDELPGTVRGSAMSDDARFVVTILDSAPVDAEGPYLGVSARTRYNRYVLPAMALSATLERDGRTVYDGPLQRTLDPDLHYHYGAALDSVESGDTLTLSVETPSQVARHEGYETAFLEIENTTVTL